MVSKATILQELKAIRDGKYRDTEEAHSEADKLLLEYIDDLEITKIYNKIKKWYA